MYCNQVHSNLPKIIQSYQQKQKKLLKTKLTLFYHYYHYNQDQQALSLAWPKGCQNEKVEYVAREAA